MGPVEFDGQSVGASSSPTERVVDQDWLQAAMREASDLSAAYSSRLSSLTQVLSVAAVVLGIAATVGVANHQPAVFMVMPFLLLTIAAYALMVSADSTAIIVLRRQIDLEINEMLGRRVLRFGDVQGVIRASSRNPSSWFIVIGYIVVLCAAVVLSKSSLLGERIVFTGPRGFDVSLWLLCMALAVIPLIACVMGVFEAVLAERRTGRFAVEAWPVNTSAPPRQDLDGELAVDDRGA